MENLVSFYEDVLALADFKIDENGFVHLSNTDGDIIKIDGKTLVIPTREQLRSLDNNKEVFHPLTEDTLVKMTKPMMTFTKYVNASLNVKLAELFIGIRNLTHSTAIKNDITKHPELLEFLCNIKGGEASDKTSNEFLKFIVKNIEEAPSKAFIEISLARGGMLNGQKFSRVGYVTFPLYKKVMTDIDKPRNQSELNLPKDSLLIIRDIYRAIFPELTVSQSSYDYGFENGPYPFFSTLLRTAKKLVMNINRAIDLCNLIWVNDVPTEKLPTNWIDKFEDKEQLSKIARLVPNLDSDTAKYEASKENGRPIPSTVKETKATIAQVIQETPVQAPKPTTNSRTIDPNEWMQKKSVPSQMGAYGSSIEAVRKHNEAYRVFYLNFLKANNNIPPMGFPHPDTIPAGQMAPAFPGMPGQQMAPQQMQPVPMQAPQVNAWGQPVQMPMQQPQLNAWGQPMQMPMQMAQPQLNAWGQPIQPVVAAMPQQLNAWGQPVQMPMQQPQVNAWGQPVQMGMQQPQMNAWGQPMQMPIQMSMQQPQGWGNQTSGWGTQTQTMNQPLIPGVR